MSNYYLEHYGVVGMRWGKRRTRALGDGVEILGSGRSSRTDYNSSRSRYEGPTIDADYRESSRSSNQSSNARRDNDSSRSSNQSSNTRRDNDSSRSSNQSSNTRRDNDSSRSSNQTSQQQTPKPKSLDTKMAKDGLDAGKKLSDVGVKKLKEERENRLEKRLKESTKDMTNAEMQEVITRLNMEQRYVDVMKKNSDPEPKSNLEKTLEIAGAVATHAETALSVYETIQKIRGR